MKKIKIIFLLVMFVLTLTSCNKQKLEVTYIISGEVVEKQEILKGSTLNPLEVPKKENKIFTGWKYNGRNYNFSQKIEKNITLTGKYEDICKINGHNYIDATCENAMTCLICGEKNGIPLEHTYSEATCKNYSTCINCGYCENMKLKNHHMVSATYERPSYCIYCGFEEGTKLLYEVKSLEYDIIYENKYLSIQQYDDLSSNLILYGILEDNTRQILSTEDVLISYQIFKDETTRTYSSYIVLEYNGVSVVTNKEYLGILNQLPIDFETFPMCSYMKVSINENEAKIYYYTDLMYEYLEVNNYDNISNMFLNNGWEYQVIQAKTELGGLNTKVEWIKGMYKAYLGELKEIVIDNELKLIMSVIITINN